MEKLKYTRPATKQENKRQEDFDVSDTNANILTKKSVDALLYYLFDADLTAEQKESVKQTFTGGRKSPSDIHKNSGKLVTEDFCARYGRLRALGLRAEDAAIAMNISSYRLAALLRGEGLSEKSHEMLLRAEAYGDVALKTQCLKTIDKSLRKGEWKAAIALLEKKFPEEYGRKLEVNSTSSVHWSSEECANSAEKAQEELARIRAEREELAPYSEEDRYVSRDLA